MDDEVRLRDNDEQRDMCPAKLEGKQHKQHMGQRRRIVQKKTVYFQQDSWSSFPKKKNHPTTVGQTFFWK